MEANTKITLEDALNSRVWFGRNHSGYNATPLKINVGRFEISVSGDDSCGALPEFRRTELIIFDQNDQQVFRDIMVSVNDILLAVKYCVENQ